MDDSRIIELYEARDERAIRETSDKYGAYIRKIAGNILGSREDTEECVNESLFRVWNTIPPNRPKVLSAYLALITREVSIDAFRKSHRKKRADSEYALSYEELSEVLADRKDETEELISRMALEELLNRFLSKRPKETRAIFLISSITSIIFIYQVKIHFPDCSIEDNGYDIDTILIYYKIVIAISPVVFPAVIRTNFEFISGFQ